MTHPTPSPMGRHLGGCAASLWLALGLSACAPTLAAPESAVLVVLQGARPPTLGIYGNPRDTSPGVDRWSERGTVFEFTISTAPWATPAMGSILTGRMPLHHGSGAGSTVDLDPSMPTLARHLGEAGWTAGLLQNEGHGDAKEPTKSGQRHDSEWLVDTALAWIGGREGPYFLTLVLDDLRFPFDPGPGARGRYTAALPLERPLPLDDATELRLRAVQATEAERAHLIAAYDEQVPAVDRALTRLLDGLEESGQLERTLVVLTGDHGVELFERGGFGEGHSLQQELLAVPLMVWGPQVRERHLAFPTSTLDIAPTVLDALGVARLPGAEGVSLWPILAGTTARPPELRPLFAEATREGPQSQAVLEWPLKLILGANDVVRLHDLSTDAGERQDLAGERPEDVQRLRDALDARHLR